MGSSLKKHQATGSSFSVTILLLYELHKASPHRSFTRSYAKVGQDSGSSDPNDPEERHNSASHTIDHTILLGIFCRDDCSSAGRSLIHTRSLANYTQRRRGKRDHHLCHNWRNSEHCLHISVHGDEAWGAGQAYVDESFPTDATGGYTQVLTYPNNTQTWNPITGTVRTNLPGNYTVTVVETAPKSVTTGFPSATFRVTSVLNVRIIAPTQASTIQRETTTYFTTTVDDVNGQHIKDAQVSVSLPTGGQLALTPTTPSGTYSGSYRVQRSDPLGLWNITATAYSPAPSTTNNFGTYNVLVTVSPSQLTVSSLSTYNQYGTPTGDFSPGNTLYASFQ